MANQFQFYDLPSTGESLGGTIGTSLGIGLQALAQGKIQQLMAQKEQQRKEQSFIDVGLPPQYARALSGLPEKTVHDILSRGLQVPGAQQVGGVVPTEGAPQVQAPGMIQLGPSPEDIRHKETIAAKREATAYKMVEPDITKIREQADTFERNQPILEEGLALLKSGKVLTGPEAGALENIKFGDTSLLDYVKNPETARFQQILSGLTTGAAGAFGTKRLTNLEVKLYEKSLSRLVDPREASERFLELELIKGKAVKAKRKAMNELISQYQKKNEALPFDLRDKADARVGDKLDIYKQQYANTALGFPPSAFKNPENVTFNYEGKKWKYYKKAFWPVDEIKRMVKERRG